MDFIIFSELRYRISKFDNLELRRYKKVPGVIYLGELSIPIFIDNVYSDSILKFWHDGVKFFSINVGDNQYTVLLKDFLIHPSKKEILHFDFQKVEDSDIIVSKVFFRFSGEKESIGVKRGGFLVKYKLFTMIKCRVCDLPEFIDVDVSSLDIDKSLYLSDLRILSDKNFKIFGEKNNYKTIIASVLNQKVTEQKV